MLIKITSKDNSKLKYASSLKEEKYRRIHNQFLAEGKNELEMALKAGLVTDVFTTQEIPNIPANQYLISPELIKKLSSTVNPEGIVFISNMPNLHISENARKVLYLDQISDPGNMGTIIRTALAFDFDGVYLSDNCVSVFNEKVIAASKGAIFSLPIEKKNFDDIKKFCPIVSTLDENSISLDEIYIKPEYKMIVIGNEAHGISKSIQDKCEFKVKIPMKNIDSLNVGVAAGILMYFFK